ncbi:MAG: hypothetical protein WC960_02115 [Bacteroidales bacterium]
MKSVKDESLKGREEPTPKKRSVVSFEKLNPTLKAAFSEKYPKGYPDYMSDVFKVNKPDGSTFYAVSFEMDDAIYLVKVEVKIDDHKDLERGLFGSSQDDDDEVEEEDSFPDQEEDEQFSESD